MNDDDEFWNGYPKHVNCLCMMVVNSALKQIVKEVGKAIVRDAEGVADLTSLYEERGLSKGN